MFPDTVVKPVRPAALTRNDHGTDVPPAVSAPGVMMTRRLLLGSTDGITAALAPDAFCMFSNVSGVVESTAPGLEPSGCTAFAVTTTLMAWGWPGRRAILGGFGMASVLPRVDERTQQAKGCGNGNRKKADVRGVWAGLGLHKLPYPHGKTAKR